MRPLGSRILIRKSMEEQEGVIIAPDSAQKTSDVAEVVAVGSEAEDCGPGDEVIIGRYAGTEVKYNGEVLWLMKDEDVLAKILDNASKRSDESLWEYTERRKVEKLAARL
jgi:chaperonin GroES